jgi:hypothetical protein
MRPDTELPFLDGEAHRAPKHGQLVLHGGGGCLLQAVGCVALQRVGRDGARLPAAEVAAQTVPCFPRPPQGAAPAVLVASAEARFEIFEGEPLGFLSQLQAEGVLAHAPLQERLGRGLLPGARRLALALAIDVIGDPVRL